MNVVPRIVGRVKLHNPVDSRNVEASRGHVCANESALFCITKLKEGICPLLLFLFTVQI
jgi:hypothetical protein